jgi:hypothetical protein
VPAGGRVSADRVHRRDFGKAGFVAEFPGSGVPLLPRERILVRLMANHIRDSTGYEGYLYVTSKRLVHIPWPAAQGRGGRASAMPLTAVTGVDAAPRDFNWRDGSWRRRLRINTSSGVPEFFVVWRPRHAVELVERARQETGTD